MKLTTKQLKQMIKEAMEKICLTPEAFYDIRISPREVGVNVRLPMSLDMSEEEATMLEQEMHDAMEQILARYFK